MTENQFAERVNVFLLCLAAIVFIVVVTWALTEEDSTQVPGQEVEGTFYTETVPVSDGQLECVVFDGDYGSGLDCNWEDRRKED